MCPLSVQTFACASNTSPANWRMTSSFKLDAGVPDYINFNTYIQGISETGAIPDFWKISIPADCRGSVSNVWIHAVPGGSCVDPFDGGASGGGGYGYLIPGVQIQIEAVYTVAAGVPLDPDVEYYLSTFTVKNGKTVGTAACAGCQTGMVFGLQEALVGLQSGPVIRLAEAYDGGNQCLIWQHAWTGQPCNAPVPSRNTTWGQVKSLYR